MDIRRVLEIPARELTFFYPTDHPKDRHDGRYKTLRSELGRRGLRSWQSFEEEPTYVQELLELPTSLPEDWKPLIHPWDCFAGSELNIADFYKKTLLQRVNIALEAVAPGLHIVGTPKHFPSYGTYDNRREGEAEKLIGPDFVVVDTTISNGKFTKLPSIETLDKTIVTIGELKMKNSKNSEADAVLPGTEGCYESWLAQSVQYCLDIEISLGFLLTNLELVVFHLVKTDKQNSQTHSMSRRSNIVPKLDALPSDATEEPECSSPAIRKGSDWVNFDDGDEDIPDVSKEEGVGKQMTSPNKHSFTIPESPRTPVNQSLLPLSPLAQRKRARRNTSESPDNSQSLAPPTPSFNRGTEPDNISIGDSAVSPEFSSQGKTESSWGETGKDERSEDPTHILIRSYPIMNNEEVGLRLFQHIMLAKRAQNLGIWKMGPFKLSHSALDELEA